MQLGIDNPIIRIELKAQLDLRLQVWGLESCAGSSWHVTVLKKIKNLTPKNDNYNSEKQMFNGSKCKIIPKFYHNLVFHLISAGQMMRL